MVHKIFRKIKNNKFLIETIFHKIHLLIVLTTLNIEFHSMSFQLLRSIIVIAIILSTSHVISLILLIKYYETHKDTLA